jgi:hypothetical protein
LHIIANEQFNGAQQSAVDCVFLTLTNTSESSTISFSELVPNIITTGFGSSRPPVKSKTTEVLMECIAEGYVDVVVPEVIKFVGHKQTKYLISSVNALTTALKFISILLYIYIYMTN